jgi:hypothetical protein
VKLLVDSCAWSLLLRRSQRSVRSPDEGVILSSLTEAIQEGRVSIIGPIRQEVLSGIRDSAQFNKLKASLALFTDEPLLAAHFEEAASLFNLSRSRGVECGPTDILLCAVAIQKHYGILTYDRGLKRCIESLRSEGMMG